MDCGLKVGTSLAMCWVEHGRLVAYWQFTDRSRQQVYGQQEVPATESELVALSRRQRTVTMAGQRVICFGSEPHGFIQYADSGQSSA